MSVSEFIIYPGGTGPLQGQESKRAEERQAIEGSSQESIPARYRDGAGGINIEQVERDQRRARQEFVRSLFRR